MRTFEIVAQAGVAVAEFSPRIAHAVAKADPADRAECLRQLHRAAALARELATRLDIAELELAAARPPPAAGKEKAA